MKAVERRLNREKNEFRRKQDRRRWRQLSKAQEGYRDL